jgi:glycerol-3-phosphate dehydrogenase (NAD(P)+)
VSLRCAVLGAGSFGTALASILAKNGHDTTLVCRTEEHAAGINEQHRNPRYVTEYALPESLKASADLAAAIEGADLIVSVAPSHATRDLAKRVAATVTGDPIVLCATKGIERGSGDTMDEVLREELPQRLHARLAFLSGPSFAREMLAEHPTAVVIAAQDDDVATIVQEAFATHFFRTYTTHDVKGVELAGALKNIVAIAAGLADGLGFGANARAALITRGLAEMSRLGAALGGEPLTFMGLAGMGDLVLTCTGDQSRNRTVGKRLATGMTLDEVTESLGGQVAEGVRTTASTHALARKMELDMPIVAAVHAILYEGADPKAMVGHLMGRPLKKERH